MLRQRLPIAQTGFLRRPRTVTHAIMRVGGRFLSEEFTATKSSVNSSRHTEQTQGHYMYNCALTGRRRPRNRNAYATSCCGSEVPYDFCQNVRSVRRRMFQAASSHLVYITPSRQGALIRINVAMLLHHNCPASRQRCFTRHGEGRELIARRTIDDAYRYGE